jgi:hypothetical protein
MNQGYSHIKHTVLYPYDKNILPVSFDEVNSYAYNVYEAKIIPDNYNPLIDSPLPDTFDETGIKNSTKIARDLFERYANVPLLFQKEQQSALIRHTDIELPLRYSYIQYVENILIKTTEVDEATKDNIWYAIPKKDYCTFVYSEQSYMDNKVSIKYSKEQPTIDTNCYENLKIIFTRGIADEPENIPQALKQGLIMHTLGLMRGDLYEGTTTCQINDLYEQYLSSRINFIF